MEVPYTQKKFTLGTRIVTCKKAEQSKVQKNDCWNEYLMTSLRS